MYSETNQNNEAAFIAFCNGQEEGFNFFFHTCYNAVYFFACKYVKDSAAAEDITENSFIKLWEKRQQMETEAGLRAYLYKTVYHGCLRWLQRETKKEDVHNIYNMAMAGEECGHIENMIRAETLRRVDHAMQQLPGECRKVFIKLFIEGKTVKETAEELRLTVSTINNQRARGIKLLKMKFGLGLVFFCMIILSEFF